MIAGKFVPLDDQSSWCNTTSNVFRCKIRPREERPTTSSLISWSRQCSCFCDRSMRFSLPDFPSSLWAGCITCMLLVFLWCHRLKFYVLDWNFTFSILLLRFSCLSPFSFLASTDIDIAGHLFLFTHLNVNKDTNVLPLVFWICEKKTLTTSSGDFFYGKNPYIFLLDHRAHRMGFFSHILWI